MSFNGVVSTVSFCGKGVVLYIFLNFWNEMLTRVVQGYVFRDLAVYK